MSEISLRVKTLIAALGVNQAAFAEKIDVSSGRLSNILTGRNKPDSEFLEKIANSYKGQVNLSWLLTGEGEPILRNVSSPVANILSEAQGSYQRMGTIEQKQEKSSTIKIPILDIKAAASSHHIHFPQGYIEEKEVIMFPDNLLKRGRQYFAFEVMNDSMQPTLNPKDYVIACALMPGDYPSIRNNAVYVIVSQDKGLRIKRIHNHLPQSGFLRCLSDNPTHQPYDVPFEEITQIYEVAGKISFTLPDEPTNLYYHLYHSLEAKIESRFETLQNKILSELKKVTERIKA